MLHPELINSREIDFSFKLFKISILEEIFYFIEFLIPELVDVFGYFFSVSDFDGDISAQNIGQS